MKEPILVGAVVYDPKVVVIWDIIKEFFEANGCPMDYIFFSNYELQVKSLLDGAIHIAWNSPLAWLDAQRRSGDSCRAIAMRDTDRDRVSHIIAPTAGPVRSLADLTGRSIATGAKDSPQSTLIPLGLLQRNGLEPGRDVQVKRFDVLVGKHGDHIGGEKNALQCLQSGGADACAMLDLNWQLWSADGTVDANRYRVLATTDRFDHCVFTVRADLPEALERPWLETLYSMSYENPAHREMMDMEGLKAWLPGRTTGFNALTEAVQRQHYFQDSPHKGRGTRARPVRELPLFPITTVGSLPRPASLLRALKAKRRGDLVEADFDRVADEAVLEALRLQEEAGVDIVTDGEQRRDNFYSFVSDKLEGVRLMSLAEMLDYVEDKAGFEKLLQTLDVPAYSINNPTCVGKVERRRPLAVDELTFLKRHTEKPIKIPLPGPYLLTRAMWVPEITGKVYADKEALAEDVVRLLREEAFALKAAGADFIQFDEPILTELVFTQGQTRTFMCAALAGRKDPTEELEFAVNLINRVVEGLEEVRTGLHVCRGNWSRNEATLLRGSYAPLKPWLERLNVRQLVLEFATSRAGNILAFEGKELGLGVVNPRTDEIETVPEILARVRTALQTTPKEKVF